MKSPAQPQAEQQPRRAAAELESTRTHTTAFPLLDDRPESMAQRQLADAINGSSYMVAQLQQFRRLFGSTAQLKTQTPSSPLDNTTPGETEKLETLRATLNASPRVQAIAQFQRALTQSPGVAQVAQLSTLQKRTDEPLQEGAVDRSEPQSVRVAQAAAVGPDPGGISDRPTNAAHAVPDAPIQGVWTWQQIKSQKGQWRWGPPKDIGDKNEKPTFDGAVHGEKYPTIVPVDLSALAKQEKIREYTPLIPHLAGELDGDAGVKGGHVWKMMQNVWGNRLQLVTGTPSQTKSWNCTWRIDARTAKGSTMFPAAWDEAKLISELTNSTVISGKLYVSGIGVKKAGDTFYPG